MRRVEAVLAVAMALTLSGCVLRGKPPVAAVGIPVTPKPAPPPVPEPKPPANLSEKQTVAELPQPQPLTLEAVASAEPPEEAPAAPAPSRGRGGRGGTRTTPPATSARSEPVGPANPPAAAAPPPQPAAAEPERPQIQEILPAAELNRLQSEATKKRQETVQRLNQLRKRPRLNQQDQDTVQQIHSYVTVSEEAQRKGDMRKAWDFAEKALVLAKALLEGR